MVLPSERSQMVSRHREFEAWADVVEARGAEDLADGPQIVGGQIPPSLGVAGPWRSMRSRARIALRIQMEASPNPWTASICHLRCSVEQPDPSSQHDMMYVWRLASGEQARPTRDRARWARLAVPSSTSGLTCPRSGNCGRASANVAELWQTWPEIGPSFGGQSWPKSPRHWPKSAARCAAVVEHRLPEQLWRETPARLGINFERLWRLRETHTHTRTHTCFDTHRGCDLEV